MSEATKQILAQRPGVSILVLTMFDDSASVLAAIRAGARGYLVKGVDRDEILRAVHAAATGDSILRLLRRHPPGATAPQTPRDHPHRRSPD